MKEVENKDFDRVDQLFDTLHHAGRGAKNKIALSFLGYDQEPREVYQIQEIREYVAALYEKYPELFYFYMY